MFNYLEPYREGVQPYSCIYDGNYDMFLIYHNLSDFVEVNTPTKFSRVDSYFLHLYKDYLSIDYGTSLHYYTTTFKY